LRSHCTLACIAFAAFGFGWHCEEANAQSPYLNPKLTVLPASPAPGAPFTLHIVDITGVGAVVQEVSHTIVGSQVEIAAGIQLGYANIGLGYVLDVDISSLPAGMHTVTYRARTKHVDTDYTSYFVEGAWNILIVPGESILRAVEYYHPDLNHYFITADASEIAALDAHAFSGWIRTGASIAVVAPNVLADSLAPICRFYGRPEAGLDTHFYSGTAYECALLAGDPAWIQERADAFRVALVASETGTCPANMLPVYRLWNGRPAANHRYTTSLSTQQEMVAEGWIPEGSGNPPRVWCVMTPEDPQ